MIDKRCKICEHGDKEKIELMLLNGEGYRSIIIKYPDLNYANIGRHKSHMFNETPEKLQELINQALRNKNLSVDNVSDLVKILDHQQRYEERYKNIPNPNAPTMEQAFAEYLGLNPEYASPLNEYIHINPDQYVTFADFLKKQTDDIEICVCPGAYQKYKEKLKHAT